MKTKLGILAIVAFSLSGCIAVPRLEVAETLTFDHIHVVQQPMSFSDIHCCYDCTV